MELPPTYVNGWSDLESNRKLQYRQFGSTNMFVSLVSFGAAHISKNAHVDVADDGTIRISGGDESIQAIRQAIRSGINFIDTSPFYGFGKSELIVAEALKTIPRKAYYLATKAGRNSDCTFDFSAKSIRQSVERSLTRFGIEQIDLLQLHDVEFGDIEMILNKSLPSLALLQAEGKIRYIGITGYSLKVLKEILERSTVKIDSVLSYCRYTFFDNELINFLDYFKSKSVAVINASIFGMGLYSMTQPIPFWHPAPKEIQDACQNAAKLSKNLGVHINRLALLHSFQETRIHTHLIGMETLEMVQLNIDTVSNDCQYTKTENEVVNRLQNDIFSHLTVHNWENVELSKYRQNPKAFADFLRTGELIKLNE
ncbi:hypothetical protein BLOT_006008 [Blomia tropicalis]|nr:hypothetical protein BLOT_006008 [Blomia tropicalis]